MKNEIKAFELNTIRSLREEINLSLKDLEVKYGIKFNLGTIRYGSNDFSVKLQCNIKKDQEIIDLQVKDHGHLIGKSFKIPGKTSTFTVIELSKDKDDTAVIITRRGKKYNISIEAVY